MHKTHPQTHTHTHKQTKNILERLYIALHGQHSPPSTHRTQCGSAQSDRRSCEPAACRGERQATNGSARQREENQRVSGRGGGARIPIGKSERRMPCRGGVCRRGKEVQREGQTASSMKSVWLLSCLHYVYHYPPLPETEQRRMCASEKNKKRANTRMRVQKREQGFRRASKSRRRKKKKTRKHSNTTGALTLPQLTCKTDQNNSNEPLPVCATPLPRARRWSETEKSNRRSISSTRVHPLPPSTPLSTFLLICNGNMIEGSSSQHVQNGKEVGRRGRLHRERETPVRGVGEAVRVCVSRRGRGSGAATWIRIYSKTKRAS